MVDIKKDFSDSFELLKHHKNIILPVFCSIILPLILIFLFFNLSGLGPLIKELNQVLNEFDEKKVDYLANTENMNDENYTNELVNYLGKDSESSDYNAELAKELIEGEYDWNRFKELLNMENLVLLIVFVAIAILGSFYLSCMTYAIIALTIKNENISSNLFRVTNKFLIRMFSLKVLTAMIFIGPLIIIGGLIASLFFLSPILGVLSIFIFVLMIFAYVIYVGLRLFFTIPSMYLEDEGSVDSIKHSFKLTKGHLKQVVIIFFMIYGITVFINSFVSQPLYESYANFLLEMNWIKIGIYFIVVSFFIVLESIVFAFEHIFLFMSYIDFKQIDEIVQNEVQNNG